MRRELLDILMCPACRSETPLDLAVDEDDGGEVVAGRLTCRDCDATYPIVGSIPRFVSSEDDYCGNFGYQWQRWRTLQIDRLSGHTLSETRFFNDSRWDRDWLAGKTILDAGCGAGRFADVAAQHGARVVAVDLSNAVDACRETTAVHTGAVDCLQASLFELPIRPGSFDGLYCMGVIQHTPDPAALMARLPDFLKPGGRVVYNFYEEGLWRRLQVIKYGLRPVTRHLSVGANLALSRLLVGLFFPITRFLGGFRRIRIANHFLPIAAVHDPQLTPEQQRAWTLLDTFDWYGAKYEKRQYHGRVAEILGAAGLVDVESRPGLSWARRRGGDGA